MQKSKRIKIPNGEGGEIIGHYYKSKDDKILVIYCHGTLSTSEFPDIRDFVGNFYNSHNISIFMFDYPGEDLKLDQMRRYKNIYHKNRIKNLEYILRYFKSKSRKIILAGHSLGTIDVVLASKFYKNLYDKQYLINGIYSFRFLPPWRWFFYFSFLFKDKKLRNDFFYVLRNTKLKKIITPTLVIVSDKDEVINPKNSYYLFKTLNCQKKLITVSNGDHALIKQKYLDEYKDQLIKWILD